MPRFSPFPALRYAKADLDDLVAPPYDVLSDADRHTLQSRDPANAVRIDFPGGENFDDPYGRAAQLLAGWEFDGTLVRDAAATFTIYRMTPPNGSATTGVLGALTLEAPGTGDILPHEQTTAKDKADRLSLLRATRVNTSPIWGLSLAAGLGALLDPHRSPDAHATDPDGVRHEVWIQRDRVVVEAIEKIAGSAPVVIADGHHRFETALTYQQEDPAADALLCFLVELSPDELEVRPIHRIISGLAPGLDLAVALSRWFDTRELDTTPVHGDAGSHHRDGIVLLSSHATTLLQPKQGAFEDAVQLDSERLVIALGALSTPSYPVEVRYHHDANVVAAAVAAGIGVTGALIRPVSVAQIRRVADSRTRMPAKSTFFWPKPRSGMLFRPLPTA